MKRRTKQAELFAPPALRVVNVKTAAPGSYVYVGRPMRHHKNPAIRQGSPFGNPFCAGDVATRLARYRRHVVTTPRLMQLLPTLKGKVLGCWCAEWDGIRKPVPACHACVLVELIDSLPPEENA
jgi:hypothetical protein